jgi:histone H3/H4
MVSSFSIDSAQKKVSTPSSSHGKKPIPRIPIQRIAKELVDESHPAVLALVKSGYSAKQSIDAIAKYGTLQKAMDHMADTSDEDEDEEESDPIPSTMRQFSREDSLPNVEMNW